MYEGYETQHSIPVDQIRPELDPSFSTGAFANYVPGTGAYMAGVFPGMVPIWYTGWRDETLSWQLTCSFHAHLNPSPLQIVRGPDAKRFMSENFVNNIENFPLGKIKHGIMCLDNGLVATHGVILRTGDDEYQIYWNSPFVEFAYDTGDYDLELIDISKDNYLFQLQGPKVLQILAEATGDDLRDIPFRGFRDSTLNGHPVRILRLGMSGNLAYEVHGPVEFSKVDQKKLLEVGNDHGMRQIGITTYGMNHTLGGYAQMTNNFLTALVRDPEYLAWQATQPSMAGKRNYVANAEIMGLEGSVGDDIEKHFFNPFEIGLGHCVNWDHDFRGKEALLEYKKTAGRRMVTLEWNVDDLADIYKSQFEAEPYRPMDFPGWETPLRGRFVQAIDYVYDADDNEVGLSIGRTQSFFHRSMISLGILEEGHRELGDEVYVLWGEPNTRQKKIRAKVARYPYNQELPNDSIDATAVSITDAKK